MPNGEAHRGDPPAQRIGGPGAPADAADVMRLAGRVSRLAVRDLSRELRARLARGRRHVVIDLSGAGEVAEGHLILALLGLRREAHRRRARIVVAARADLRDRLARGFALDDRIRVAATVEEAVAPEGRRAAADAGATPDEAATPPAPMRCLQCGTTWYSRVAALILDAGMTCARCGAPLAAPTRAR